ncbi:hypothetical protein FRB96_004681 [Tulasnella sp. 330]|nr:hypothetical protein FRB96_004681 [Tulasnella sp. 330]KAG8878801.1 hypothetical protein FRB97_002218 [Tulasnella sp. 331]KAG8888588.1 hypothetical protein FRB98_007352 [Tulasnella sp. 332]
MALNVGRRLLARQTWHSASRTTALTPLLSVQQRRSQTTNTKPVSQPVPREVMKDGSKADIDASRLNFERNSSPKELLPPQKLIFGHTFTDHMLSIPWTLEKGWGVPRIHPYEPLSLDPSSSVFHYCQTVFEGLKAYRDENGKVTLFRPEMNMARMIRSAGRVALPPFNGDELLTLIKKLVAIDSHWIPQGKGYSLYIRPTLIGVQTTLGVSPPNKALLFVICSPVGPYYKGGFKPVRLLATTEYVRAVPGGTGGFKLGANYAPCLVPQGEANQAGYDQNLWLLGEEHYLTEVGTMNLFVVLKKADGTTELVTPPLDDVVLPGVTRDSVLGLARDQESGKSKLSGFPEKMMVSERPITMKEVKEAADDGRLLEVFGCGTAAIVSAVKAIGYQGKDINIPVGDDGMGPLTKAFHDEIVKRQLGEVDSDWSVVVPPYAD